MVACKAIQELVYKHLTMVSKAAKEVAGEVLKEQMEAVEQRVKANLEKIEKFKHSAVLPPPTTSIGGQQQQTLKPSPSLTSLSEAHNEDGECEDNDHMNSVAQTNIPFQNQEVDPSLALSSSSSSTLLKQQPSTPTKQDLFSTASFSNSTPGTTNGSGVAPITRSVSLPTPSASSIIIGAGNLL